MSLPFLLQDTEEKKPVSFVPRYQIIDQPFVELAVKSSGPDKKYIVVNADESLSVKAFDLKECRQTATFVKIEVPACPGKQTTE